MMGTLKRPGRPKKFGVRYPWDEWFRGAATGDGLTLHRGRHYEIATHGMAQMIRNRASERGVGVTLSISADGRRITVRVRGDR